MTTPKQWLRFRPVCANSARRCALTLSLLTCACTSVRTQPDASGSAAFGEISNSWGLPQDYIQFGPATNNSPFVGDRASSDGKATGLLVPLRRQEMGSWCSLASIQMVASYYGLVTDQCRLADLRDGYPEGTCCANPSHPRCDHGTELWPTIQVLAALGLYGAASPKAPSEEELRVEIVNGRPLISIQVANAFSHAIVIFGYDPGSLNEPATFAVNDPMTGYRQLSYEALRTQYWDGSSVFSGAFYRLAPSPNGCNTGFDPSCGGT